MLLTFVEESSCGKCPKPEVRRKTIIRSKESIRNGARLIGKDIVASARECYSLCCNDESCNVAVMHYKNEFDISQSIETCFRFDCPLVPEGSPSVCTFDEHSRYAVIVLVGKGEGVGAVK